MAAALGLACLTAAAIATAPGPDTRRAESVNRRLGLAASTLQRLEIQQFAGGPVAVQVTIAGELRTLQLVRHSVRSESYEVRAQQADGRWVTVDPHPVRTLRGSVAGVAGSTVAGSLLDDGLYAVIRMSDDTRYWVEPVATDPRGPASTPENLHVVYAQADVLPTGRSCAAVAEQRAGDLLPTIRSQRPVAVAGSGPVGRGCVTKLACDADVEFYQAHNSSVPDVESRINLVVNIVNIQFETEVAITHAISTILVRTAEPDPYASTAPNTLLEEFRDQWNNNHSEIERDIAQLFTGKDLDGTVVGIAFVRTVCGPLGYSVVQSGYSGFSCSTDLTAHELGHSWGALHCDCSLPPYTMNPIIMCSNRFNPVSTQPVIEQFRDQQPCVDCLPAIQFSFPMGLPDVLNPAGGSTVQVLIEAGVDEPAAGTAMLHMVVNGAPFVSFPMTETAVDLYDGVFPSFECADRISYFFSVETTEQRVVTSPPAAPKDGFAAMAGTLVWSRFLDDFQTDQSWSVTDAGLTDGAWQRAVPISLALCDRGNPGEDGDGSGMCYLTDNDPADCDSDVDGGSTTLMSPTMDASGAGIAVLSYDRWFDNTGNGAGPNPFEDTMLVDVSDDDGATWFPLETVGPVGAVTGGWVRKSHLITDAGIAQTDQLRLRFVAQDLGGESTVEAGVDGVHLQMVVCCPWDLDGTGDVGITDFLELLSVWGTDPGGPPDFDGDGTVGITDFLELLGNWGACP